MNSFRHMSKQEKDALGGICILYYWDHNNSENWGGQYEGVVNIPAAVEEAADSNITIFMGEFL